jgi:hypothetical protein
LDEFGFEQNEFGEWRAEACTVLFYGCFGDFEVDITLPDGGVVGFDVPVWAVAGRTAAERAEKEKEMRKTRLAACGSAVVKDAS